MAHSSGEAAFNPDQWIPYKKAKPRPTKSEAKRKMKKQLKSDPKSWEEHKARQLKRGRR